MSLALPEEGLFDIRVHTENEVYCPIDGGYRLCLRLPGVVGGVRVMCQGMDLRVQVGDAARRVPLPDSLRDAVVADVSLEHGTLGIDLRRKEGGEA